MKYEVICGLKKAEMPFFFSSTATEAADATDVCEGFGSVDVMTGCIHYRASA